MAALHNKARGAGSPSGRSEENAPEFTASRPHLYVDASSIQLRLHIVTRVLYSAYLFYK